MSAIHPSWLFVLLPLAGIAHAQLVIEDSRAQIGFARPGETMTYLYADWSIGLANPDPVGLGFARADIPQAELELDVASVGPASGEPPYRSWGTVETLMRFTLRNTGAAPILVPSFDLQVNSRMNGFPGDPDFPAGYYTYRVSATASASAPGGTGFSSVTVNLTGRDAEPFQFDVGIGEIGGGRSTVQSAQWNALRASLDTGDFLLGAQETASLSFTFSAFAFGYLEAYAAAVSAMPGAQLVWQPPPGVSVSAAVPLYWAAPIPEPHTAALFGAGVLMLIGLRREGARTPPGTPADAATPPFKP